MGRHEGDMGPRPRRGPAPSVASSLGAISGRSRGDLGAISGRSRSDLGPISRLVERRAAVVVPRVDVCPPPEEHLDQLDRLHPRPALSTLLSQPLRGPAPAQLGGLCARGGGQRDRVVVFVLLGIESLQRLTALSTAPLALSSPSRGCGTRAAPGAAESCARCRALPARLRDTSGKGPRRAPCCSRRVPPGRSSPVSASFLPQLPE